MADVFIEAGIVAVAVHSKMKDSDVNAAFDGLENGSIHILTSCDKIGEGIDIPRVVGAILLRKTKSLSLYLQWCGRPLRLYPGENTAYILDHAGNAELHGHVLDARDWSLHSENVTERKKKLPTTTHCPRCMGLWPGTPQKCPECACDLTKKEKDKKQKMPKEIEGELIDFFPKNIDPNKIKELTGDILKLQKMSPKTRQKYLIRRAFELQNREEIAALNQAVGYKKGWTKYVWTNILKNRW
jgi:superfamily II DNA or RNA helicase